MISYKNFFFLIILLLQCLYLNGESLKNSYIKIELDENEISLNNDILEHFNQGNVGSKFFAGIGLENKDYPYILFNKTKTDRDLKNISCKKFFKMIEEGLKTNSVPNVGKLIPNSFTYDCTSKIGSANFYNNDSTTLSFIYILQEDFVINGF